jgi:hypothetical protein
MAATLVASIYGVDLVSFVHTAAGSGGGSKQIVGILRVDIRESFGKKLPARDEGQLLATGADRVGQDAFPVSLSVSCETLEAQRTLLRMAEGTTVVTAVAKGNKSNLVYTVVNCSYEAANVGQARSSHGTAGAEGSAYSPDGTTSPLTITGGT